MKRAKNKGYVVTAQEWLQFANVQKDKLIKEIEHLAKEMIDRISHAPIFEDRDEMVEEARKSLNDLMAQLKRGKILVKLGKVLETARCSKDDLLHFFHVPTRRDLSKLQKKVTRLETKLDSLSHTEPPAQTH